MSGEIGVPFAAPSMVAVIVWAEPFPARTVAARRGAPRPRARVNAALAATAPSIDVVRDTIDHARWRPHAHIRAALRSASLPCPRRRRAAGGTPRPRTRRAL